MMHFPPCFRFPPYFRKIFGLSEFFLQFYLFPTNFLTFIRAKISDDLFFSHRPQILFRISPLFRCFSTFPPLFRENYSFPPTLTNFPPSFRQINLLFTCFTSISFPPYFDHDAFMHHPMHVLDASARLMNKRI